MQVKYAGSIKDFFLACTEYKVIHLTKTQSTNYKLMANLIESENTDSSINFAHRESKLMTSDC